MNKKVPSNIFSYIIFKFGTFAAHGWTVFLEIFISNRLGYLLGVKLIRLQIIPQIFHSIRVGHWDF